MSVCGCVREVGEWEKLWVCENELKMEGKGRNMKEEDKPMRRKIKKVFVT